RNLVQRYPKLRPRLCPCKHFHEKYNVYAMQFTLFRYARRRPGDPALRTKKSQVQFWMSSHSPIYLDEFPKKSPHLGASAVKKSVAVRRVQGKTSDAL